MVERCTRILGIFCVDFFTVRSSFNKFILKYGNEYIVTVMTFYSGNRTIGTMFHSV